MAGDENVSLEVLRAEFAHLRETVSGLDKRIEKEVEELEDNFEAYVQQSVFEAFKAELDRRIRPMERLLYGTVGVILLTFLSTLVALVYNASQAGVSP